MTVPRKPLSPRQRQMLVYIRTYTSERGLPPSLREIGAVCGIPSTSTVSYHLDRLAARGYLRRVPGIARGVILLEERSHV